MLNSCMGISFRCANTQPFLSNELGPFHAISGIWGNLLGLFFFFSVVPSTFLLNCFCAFLGGMGRGEGAPLVQYLCKTLRSLHERHV